LTTRADVRRRAPARTEAARLFKSPTVEERNDAMTRYRAEQEATIERM
jgi:hypothetical protein